MNRVQRDLALQRAHDEDWAERRRELFYGYLNMIHDKKGPEVAKRIEAGIRARKPWWLEGEK